MERVCIVVLNWNGWRDTLACVASLQRLEYTNCDVLVVDNGSTDGSVEEIRKTLPELEILETGCNLGFGGGCNAGIRLAMARGADYVWLVNNDATVDPAALSALVHVADESASVGAAGSVVMEADDPSRLQLWGGGRINLWLGRSIHCVEAGPIDFVSGASMLLRCRALEQVGLFDDKSFFMYWEDTDLGFRLRNAGWDLAVAEGSRIYHQQSASLGAGSLLLDEYATRSCVRFLRIHAPVPAISVLLTLLRMLVKRVLVGRFDRLRAVWKAYRSA